MPVSSADHSEACAEIKARHAFAPSVSTYTRSLSPTSASSVSFVIE
jgi:hypothetical protein